MLRTVQIGPKTFVFVHGYGDMQKQLLVKALKTNRMARFFGWVSFFPLP